MSTAPLNSATKSFLAVAALPERKDIGSGQSFVDALGATKAYGAPDVKIAGLPFQRDEKLDGLPFDIDVKLDGLPFEPGEKLDGLPFEIDGKDGGKIGSPVVPDEETPDHLLLMTHRLAHQLLSGFPGPFSGLPFTPDRDPTEG